MKLLVTGGAGYIGSIVARLLIENGHEIVVLDNLERGHREAVPAEAQLIVGDLRNPEDPRGALRPAGSTACCTLPRWRWLASRSSTPSSTTARTSPAHSTCWRRWSPRRSRVLSSAPPAPSTGSRMRSRSPRPRRRGRQNAYGASKLAADYLIGDFCTAYEIGGVSLRYFNVAGAHGEAGEDHEPETHLIPNVLKVPLGPARPRSDLRHRLPDRRRHRRARLHPHRRPRRGASARARARARGRASDLQPRQRQRLLRA